MRFAWPTGESVGSRERGRRKDGGLLLMTLLQESEV